MTLLALLITACQPEMPEGPPPGTFPAGGETLAIVDGASLPVSVVDAILSTSPDMNRAEFEASSQYAQFLDGLVTQEILYRKAIEAGTLDEPATQVLLALAEREAIVRSHMEAIAAAGITDEAVRQEYEDKAVQYARPSVHASHILVRDAAVAAEIKAKLDAGEDFGALAAEYSVDPGSKDTGGDLGWFERERMLTEVADAAFDNPVGSIVGPVESRVGFHIIKVDERRESVPLEEVEAELRDGLKQGVLDTYVREIKAAATITYPEADETETPADHDEAGEPENGSSGDDGDADDTTAPDGAGE